jgi:RNA polymerase sigma factor (sigma-70 family)
MELPWNGRTRTPAPCSASEAIRERETLWLRQISARGPDAEHAMDQLVDAYEEKILSFCVWHGNLSLAEAEDVLQDLWSRIHEKATVFLEGKTPSSWIWSIVRNMVADTHRNLWRARREQAGENSDEELSALADLDARGSGPRAQAADECVQRKLQAVSKLYPEEAMALRLRHLEEWGIPELAQYLERTEVATRRFLSDVRLKFRPHFLPCFELLPR